MLQSKTTKISTAHTPNIFFLHLPEVCDKLTAGHLHSGTRLMERYIWNMASPVAEGKEHMVNLRLALESSVWK